MSNSVEDQLIQLREVVVAARPVPLSGACVVNRGQMLESIDELVRSLPEQLTAAQRILDLAQASIDEGKAEAARIVAEAESKASRLAEESELVQAAMAMAASVRAEAESEAEALRRETDLFIDTRMAGFESVLQKTASQVKTARARLSERSGLD
jgi:peptidoglycan hydrolase CwlO-like protein